MTLLATPSCSPDAGVDLLLRHLHQLAVLLLGGQQVDAEAGHPVVHLDLLQGHPARRVLYQHPGDQVLQFRGDVLLGREVERLHVGGTQEKKN